MKKIYIALAILIVVLQARLLSSDGGLGELFVLQDQLNTLEKSLEEQRLENVKLAKEVKSLQTNPAAIETLARQNLGMVKEDEVFVQVIELKTPEVEEEQDIKVNSAK
ncbi:septum formation initiator family protein [Thiomicrorhabdus sp. Milos-T2]|uniref:FtsB family cell division protein n=1 Tax=Thiomicrorhabdus sp. Milos-T2 TaxID=90814 RepID=UPI00068E4E8F|nr:septum formation initiator family protein [Thiomicrorhabdus sp. Milos-T2]